MLQKQLLKTLMATLIIFGLSSFALAAEPGSEAGEKITATESAWDKASNRDYDQERLDAVATEAGDYEVHFDSEPTKAEMAAKDFNYNQDRLDAIGTEAGVYEQDAGPVCMAC